MHLGVCRERCIASSGSWLWRHAWITTGGVLIPSLAASDAPQLQPEDQWGRLLLEVFADQPVL